METGSQGPLLFTTDHGFNTEPQSPQRRTEGGCDAACGVASALSSGYTNASVRLCAPSGSVFNVILFNGRCV